MKRVKQILHFPFYIASRYLLSRGEPKFASFLTIIAIAGVSIGIASLILVISVMNGFGLELEKKLMGFNPHITIISEHIPGNDVAKKILDNFDSVTDVQRFASGEVVAQSESSEGPNAIGAKVFGFNKIPKRMIENTDFYWGRLFSSWLNIRPKLRGGVVLGQEMLYQIGAHPDLGDEVQLIAPFGAIDPFGNPSPRRRQYDIIGGFKSGFFEYDVKYVLMDYRDARYLLGTQGQYGFHVMLKNTSEIKDHVKNIQDFLGTGYKVYGWSAKNKKLFAALKLEKLAMSFLLFLIIVISSFSIIGVSLMIFFSKRRDLAILMAMGASQKNITRVFLCHGALIGFIGSLFGGLVGVVGCLLVAKSNIALPPTYYLDYLPVSLNKYWVVLVMFGGVIMSLLASLYPAKRAGATDPLELLRYE